MSSDTQVLRALALKTGKDMRYFEKVMIFDGSTEKDRECMMCLGRHSVFFMRRNLNMAVDNAGDEGELMYAHLCGIVQDKSNLNYFLIQLGKNASGWKAERVYVKSESREALVDTLRCLWQTDYMWRLGKVGFLSIREADITNRSEDSKKKPDPSVSPFQGYQWKYYQGYKFMTPQNFVDRPNSIQLEATGEYVVDATKVSLTVHVHEQLTVDQSKALGRDHIRWVALEYKAQIVHEEKTFYVLRNAPYYKRMNLANDFAAWSAWELIIRTKTAALICILLRRQYIPPVCNCLQDLAIMVRCPADEKGAVADFDRMLREAYLMADTMCSLGASTQPYRDIIIAKLDALRFDDEGIEWIASHIKLKTKWRRMAKKFLRAILTLYIDDGNPQVDKSILTGPEDEEDPHPVINAEANEEWAELNDGLDIELIIEQMRNSVHKEDATEAEVSTLANKFQGDRDDFDQVKNRWLQRVARYFAWAVDGGLLGNKFTLDIMIENLAGLAENPQKKAMQAIEFMCHLRDPDMSKAFFPAGLVQQLKDPTQTSFVFNERVMYSILSTDYLKKQFGRKSESEYFACLGRLVEQGKSINLRAYVCRIYMEQKPGADTWTVDATQVVIPPLMRLLRNEGLFLATYATAALVNISSENHHAKTTLMVNAIARVVVLKLKTKDDDLMCYLLMLLVNVTKEPHTRNICADNGLLPILYDILTSSYHQCGGHSTVDAVSAAVPSSPQKQKILAQTAIIIGQFCNDVNFREQFKEMFPHTDLCLIYIFVNSSPGGALSCKAMFALKQLCAEANGKKQIIGGHVIRKLMDDIEDPKVEKTLEYVHHAMLLLQMLAGLGMNCMKLEQCNAREILKELRINPVIIKSEPLRQKIEGLIMTIRKKVDNAPMT